MGFESVNYCARLQGFFLGLSTWQWESEHPDTCFVRDFDELPKRSPFDIDILVPHSSFDRLLDQLEQEAGERGLFLQRNTTPTGAFALIFDLDNTAKGRCWAFFELHPAFRTPDLLVVQPDEIDIDRSQLLPIPSAPWRAVFSIAQGLKKQRISRAIKYVCEQKLDSSDCQIFTADKLGISPDEMQELLSESDLGKQVITRLASRVKIAAPRPAAPRSAIRHWIQRNLYFLHLGSPLVFTIHGPDGVGKTTVAEIIKDTLAILPVQFSTFHHITGWKYPVDGKPAVKEPPAQFVTADHSLMRRALRYVYRNLFTDRLRELWVDITGYHNYCRKLHMHIDEERLQNKLIFVDRYIYDLITKNLIMKRSYSVIHWLFGRLLARPRLAFVLIDKPAEIRSRKQELSVEQIVEYQDTIRSYLHRASVKHCIIEVAGRKPPEIAREILDKMLEESGAAIFSLVRTWGKSEKEKALSLDTRTPELEYSMD